MLAARVTWLFLIAALHAAQPDPARAPPIDRCSTDASFVEFRDQLLSAVGRKDVAALRPLVAEDVQISLGNGDQGWREFVREWGLEKPEDSALWGELSEVLALGCDEYEGLRIAPGNFRNLWEYAGLPPLFAVEKGAALRSRPDDDAPIVMRLDYHVLLEIPDYDPDLAQKFWLHARLTDGRSGYVHLYSVRSAIDYRAAFEKQGERWVLASFLSGD